MYAYQRRFKDRWGHDSISEAREHGQVEVEAFLVMSVPKDENDDAEAEEEAKKELDIAVGKIGGASVRGGI